MIAFILQGITSGFAAGVQPGPLQAYIILQALKNGWRRSIVYALVPLLSDLPIIALVLFVLTMIPDAWVIALQLMGGLFLLYLAWKALRSVEHLTDEVNPGTESRSRNYFQAVLINLLNPNPYLFWSLIS